MNEQYECDCCAELFYEPELTETVGPYGGRSYLVCSECHEECGGRCDVIQGRIDRRESIAEERLRQQEAERERAVQMSEVRESLRMTLERQARRNQTNV